MAKCDICGTTSSLYEMTDLLDSYRTDDIRSLCRSCEKWVNAELWKIRDENCETLKERIRERAGRKKSAGWFRRLIGK